MPLLGPTWTMPASTHLVPLTFNEARE